ncbi:Cytochrome P450 family protein [Ceratobasidium theobromae]|uniref:Cytochrome P450 family protein n=1 Tax=Ceratobasidium theobromae TaxID=1582974 RepID=A0A5N5QAS1_9AGAM|nr:Cytochrome P450 family protein [Ceratobasidium theobromae]
MIENRTLVYVAPSLATLTLLHYLWRRTTRHHVVHPPSPASLPLIGNVLSMPSGFEHLAFMTLGKQLNSDIIFLNLLGHNIVVLNSAQAASDLLKKRSAIYSERACPEMLRDPQLLDWSRAPGILGYNDIWRHHRRMMHNWLNPRAVVQFHKMQEHQARLLLQRMLDISVSPSKPFESIKDEFFYTMAATMFRLAYGYTLQGRHDPFFKDIREAVHRAFNSVMFTNFYVNLFPALARVPDWFPGTSWKRTIRKWREDKEHALDAPFEWTKAQVAEGTAEVSMLGTLLQDHELTSGLSTEERDSRLKELGVTTYSGGTDTSSTALLNFVAAMVLNPQVQAKAQQELDAVLGPGTLPTVSDRERLPYINKLILEVLRWRPVAPNAIPHMCLEDDKYRGYDILKNTIIMGNLWAMSRDEQFYKNPEIFDPERFTDPSVPCLPAFGWGRRKCPGMHFSESSLFIVIASLLTTFTFSKKKDENGNDIDVKIEDASNALVLEMKPFDFEFKSRSEKHEQLILEAT